MNPMDLVELWRGALVVAATVAAPFVLTALAVGLAVAIFQTATQLQENVLVFAPKIAAALVVAAIFGHWFLDRLQTYALHSFAQAAVRLEGP
jgi:flagellar biosynthesis protein FliQ